MRATIGGAFYFGPVRLDLGYFVSAGSYNKHEGGSIDSDRTALRTFGGFGGALTY